MNQKQFSHVTVSIAMLISLAYHPALGIDVLDAFDRGDDTDMCCTDVGNFEYIEVGTVTGFGDTAEIFNGEGLVFGAEGLGASGPGIALIDVDLADVSIAADIRFEGIDEPFNPGTNNTHGFIFRRATVDGAYGAENEGQVEVSILPGGGLFLREIDGGGLNVLLHDNPFGGSINHFYSNPGELPTMVNGAPFDVDADGVLEEDEPFRLGADLIGNKLTVAINDETVAEVDVSRSAPVGPRSVTGLYKNRFTGAGGLDPFNAVYDNLSISGTEFVIPPPPPIRHVGDTDPLDESWLAFNGGAGVANNGPVDDDGILAWNIDDQSQAGGSREAYTRSLTADQTAQAEQEGWTMSGALRFLGIDDDPDGAVELSVFPDSEAGYVLWFGADEDGNPILAEFSGSQLDGTFAIGRTATVEGDGYHNYDMIYDADAKEVNVFADGQLVIEDMEPLLLDSGPTILNRILWGSNDSSGTGNANYSFVEFRIGSSLPGDFNGDGVLDATDIDILSGAIQTGSMDLQFDVNGDTDVNDGDRSVWVNELKNTYFGDSNLDGEFNSSDFVTVFQAGQYEDGIAANSTWSTGDWNGDGEFDSADFVLAFQEGGFEQGPRGETNAVPEPASLLVLLSGFAGLALRIRRR